MIRAGLTTQSRGDLIWIVRGGRRQTYTSWAGDLLAGRYDKLMETRVFPKIFGANYDRHTEMLRSLYAPITDMRVLELGTGSGNAAYVLNKGNTYTGVDISPRLLKIAAKRFSAFVKASFFVASADDLPFVPESFDACICVLSLNFFPDLERVMRGIANVLAPGGTLYGCVPVATRAARRIRGTQISEPMLCDLMRRHGIRFTPVGDMNGALLYFTAQRI